MKKFFAVVVCMMMVFAAYVTMNTVTDTTPVVDAKGSVYTGTIYVAGMGGHFTAADVSIDPSNTDSPISITNMDRIVIGSKDTHPTHDARIDSNDRTKMYWSTYKIEKGKDRIAHVGISDLKTGKVLMDKEIKLDDRAAWTGALYCASGQTKKSYMPITMTGESYIDVFSKKDLKLKERVFLSDMGYKENYLFYHGTNDNAMTKFAMTINLTEKWPKADSPGSAKGVIDMMILDLDSLEKGKVKVLAKNTVTGDSKKTKTFRQSFTPDGKFLMQSAADRMYLFDGNTLELLDEEMMEAGENHDVISSPDGKYGILTLRSTDANGMTDGAIQLYDVNTKAVVGKPVSVCNACHEKMMGAPIKAVLCGADANWK